MVAELYEINSQLKLLEDENKLLLTQLCLQANTISDLQKEADTSKSKKSSEEKTDNAVSISPTSRFF